MQMENKRFKLKRFKFEEERLVKSIVYELYKPKLWGYLKGGFLYRVNFFYTKAIPQITDASRTCLTIMDDYRQ